MQSGKRGSAKVARYGRDFPGSQGRRLRRNNRHVRRGRETGYGEDCGENRTSYQAGEPDRKTDGGWLGYALELIDDVTVAPTGGKGECSAAEFVLGIEVRAAVDENGGNIGVTFLSCQMQRCIGDTARCVNIGSGIYKDLSHLGVAEGGGVVEGPCFRSRRER